jgi:hypothetical protein
MQAPTLPESSLSQHNIGVFNQRAEAESIRPLLRPEVSGPTSVHRSVSSPLLGVDFEAAKKSRGAHGRVVEREGGRARTTATSTAVPAMCVRHNILEEDA